MKTENDFDAALTTAIAHDGSEAPVHVMAAARRAVRQRYAGPDTRLENRLSRLGVLTGLLECIALALLLALMPPASHLISGIFVLAAFQAVSLLGTSMSVYALMRRGKYREVL